MFTGIFAFLAELVSLIFWLLERHAATTADPVTQYEQRLKTIDSEFAHRQFTDDDLLVLERMLLTKSDPK